MSHFNITQSAQLSLSMMDLTSLNDGDTESDIIELCHKAQTSFGSPAALCVFPKFVPLARQQLNKLGLANVKVATVTNFPVGSDNIVQVIQQTKDAVANGADEIDLVLPYHHLIAGDSASCLKLVQACREICQFHIKLKVIIESGALGSTELIHQASQICIDAKADFIKTSTGKVAVNATLAAAQCMLTTVKENNCTTIGIKISGGVKTVAQAQQYLNLASDIMGQQWLNPNHFRFGASSLLASILDTLNNK